MSYNRMTTYTALALLGLSILAYACDCIVQDYKTGACDYYELQPDGTRVFIEQIWMQENCGCDDLEERFSRAASGLRDNQCITCNHPYDSCPSFSTCD